MKPVFVILFALYYHGHAIGQVAESDSSNNHLKFRQKDTIRVISLVKLSRSYLYEKPVTGISYGLDALQLAKKMNFERGIGMALNALGNCYRMTGNYTKAAQLHFEALRLFDKLNDVDGLASSYHGVSVVNEDQGYYHESLTYAHKVLHYAALAHNDPQLMRIQSNMGLCFEKLGILDSALYYEQNAYQLCLKLKDSTILGNVLSRLGNIYIQMKEYEIALVYYRTGIRIALIKNDNNSQEELFHALSSVYRNEERYDSSLYYARRAYAASVALKNPTPIIRSCILLTNHFKLINQPDSALKYQSIAMDTKDTLLTYQKIREQQLLALQETDRQREKAENELRNKAKRQSELQYAFIGVCIVSIFVVFLILSQSIIVKSKTIIYFGVIALLLSFEFVNLLLHPLLEKLTYHSPVFMLLSLVSIAAILVPLHHRLEKWITYQLVEKNKKIRLAAAKKTILTLEKNSGDS